MAPRIILASLPSFCQKLSKLVEIRRSSDKNNFAQFFRHGVDIVRYTLILYIGVSLSVDIAVDTSPSRTISWYTNALIRTNDRMNVTSVANDFVVRITFVITGKSHHSRSPITHLSDLTCITIYIITCSHTCWFIHHLLSEDHRSLFSIWTTLNNFLMGKMRQTRIKLFKIYNNNIIIITTTIFMVLSSWRSAIARVHPVHLMNADSA